jgi:hypothetical protein
MMVAVDVDGGAIWFGEGGHWFDGGDPAAGRSPALTGVTTPVFPALSAQNGPIGCSVSNLRLTRASWRFRPPSGFREVGFGRVDMTLCRAGLHTAIVQTP